MNLFHSFTDFSIDENESVYFTNPVNVNTIFSRVTGDNPSRIFGTLGVSEGGTADLFFINPNGIVFGENARLDLQGSFSATTADGIRLGNSGLFSATSPETSQLLNVQPSAFLFNGQNQRSAITISSDARLGSDRNRGLQVSDRQSMTFVAGDIAVNGGHLNAWEGRINLAAIASRGSAEVLDDGSLLISEGTRRGDITLTQSERIETSTQNLPQTSSLLDVQLEFGGNIQLLARDLKILDGSQVLGGIETERGNGIQTQSGNIIVDATGDVVINGQGSLRTGDNSIAPNAVSSGIQNIIEDSAEGLSGNIIINAQSLAVSDNAEISIENLGAGAAGLIVIQLQETATLDGGKISSEVSDNATGEGGSIIIRAEDIYLLNRGEISSSSSSSDTNAGPIALIANRRLESKNGRIITSSNSSAGGGIILSAETVILNERSIVRSTSDAQDVGSTLGSRSTLSAGENRFLSEASVTGGEGSLLSFFSPSSNGSGGFTITQTGNSNFISIDGNSLPNAGNRTITQNSNENVVILNENGVFSSENGIVTRDDGAVVIRDRDNNVISANAGDVTVSSNALVIIAASDIVASSRRGSGGKIDIQSTLFSNPLKPVIITEGGLSNEQVEQLFISNNRADINASGVVPGSISIGNTIFAENSLAQLSDEFLDSETIVANVCSVRSGNNSGVFTLTGND